MSSTRMLQSRLSNQSKGVSIAPQTLSEVSPPTTFTKVSPIHGVGRLAEGSGTVRFFYTGLILAAVGATTACLYYTVDDIVSNPSTVTRVVKPRSSIPLPKVTICNLNPVRLSKLQEFEEYIENMEPDTSEAEALYFGSGKECVMCIDGEIDPALFWEKYAKLPSELKSAFGHQISDLLLSCSFRGEACSVSEFTSYVDDVYGNCYSFNHDVSPFSVNKAGSENGLILELDLETSEYIPHVSETIGVRVLLESTEIHSCQRLNEITIPPGRDNFIGMKSSITTGPCSSKSTFLSAGVWPTSFSKSNSLTSVKSSDSISEKKGLVETTSSSITTSIPPTLEEIEGSGELPNDEAHVIEPDDFLSHLSKREVSELYYETPTIRNKNTQKDTPASTFTTASFQPDVTIINNSNNENNDDNDDGNNANDEDDDAALSNQRVDDQHFETLQEAGFDSADSRAQFSNFNMLERRRRAANGDEDDDAANTTSSPTSSPTSSADTIASARERMSKLRVYYTSLDEEVESSTPVYPWYIATALIGGQLALFLSLSAVAIIEAIECFFRFVGRCYRKIRPSNKIGTTAW